MDFKLKIITPNGIYFENDVTRIDVKTLSGNIGVLARHIPIVSGLEISPMTILKGDKRNLYALHGGILNVLKNEVVIITEAIEKKEDIDKRRAEQAKDKAAKRLKETSNFDNTSELALKRAITRLKI